MLTRSGNKYAPTYKKVQYRSKITSHASVTGFAFLHKYRNQKRQRKPTSIPTTPKYVADRFRVSALADFVTPAVRDRAYPAEEFFSDFKSEPIEIADSAPKALACALLTDSGHAAGDREDEAVEPCRLVERLEAAAEPAPERTPRLRYMPLRF